MLPTPVLEPDRRSAAGGLADLAQVPWFGEKILRLYGKALLQVLS